MCITNTEQKQQLFRVFLNYLVHSVGIESAYLGISTKHFDIEEYPRADRAQDKHVDYEPRDEIVDGEDLF
jgi:hypothetical protein